MAEADSQRRRVGLVLSGGGARGAYEAGVLAHLFEEIYPQLPPGFEFDVLSGTSVGAIHAAYVGASAHLEPEPRTRRLTDTWHDMRVNDVLQLSAGDIFGVPLRALGMTRLGKRLRAGAEVIGGLVDIAPLERLVAQRIPWEHLRANLERGRPGVLCVSCTQVRTGRVNVFMEGSLADPRPWDFDPNASAEPTELAPLHVRASAAIPFFFPAVRIGDRYFLDGGLRINTPLSPALRLGCDRVLVIGLKHLAGPSEEPPAYPEEVIAQPVFLLGKVLNALMLDRLEYDLQRVGLVNALIDHGRRICGADFLEQLNVAVRAQRGADYRHVDALTLRPSRDLGAIAATCYDRQSRRDMGFLPALLTRVAKVGVPEGEADLLSYLLFDRCYTQPLMELGREDARAQSDQILELLGA
jgi:NTE family protein